MKRTLGKYLEIIGNEIHDTGYADITGTIRPITKDEMLAREVWKRALGYEQETKNTDGTMVHRIFPADPKMQQFIFERREGKNVEIRERDATSLLDRISELAKNQVNAMAEKAADDRNDE